MQYALLVRKLLQATGKNQSELARRLKTSQGSISRWAKGAQEPKHHQMRVIEDYAVEIGVIDQSDVNQSDVPLVGFVGLGGEISYGEGQGPFGEAPVPPGGATKTTVAVMARGDSMAGQLEDGWTAYYDNRQEPPTEDILGKLCVVGLVDGRVLVKRLIKGRGPGLYDLYSASAPVLLDQAVLWAAKVTWIKPD